MTIRQISWRRYAVPFVSPFRTAHGVMTQREGLILRLRNDDGRTGVGEAAPLAEFGGGDVARTAALLASLEPQLIGRTLDEIEGLLAALLPDRPATSALRFAFDTALLDLQARQQGVRLAELLAPHARSIVPLNATIGQPTTHGAVQAAREAAGRGFRTVKLKVGVGGTVAAEIERVGAVRDAIGPLVDLRLDANGAWSPEQAIANLNALASCDVALVEQPVSPSDLAGLARVRRSVPIPVAADEAVTNLAAARRIIELDAADVLVVKPMVCGGLRAARRIIEVAHEAGLRSVVTSSLESGVGVTATFQLAAALPDQSLACGLATLDLLEDDLIVERLAVTNGEMRLQDGPGLGVTMDEEALVRYGT